MANFVLQKIAEATDVETPTAPCPAFGGGESLPSARKRGLQGGSETQAVKDADDVVELFFPGELAACSVGIGLDLFIEVVVESVVTLDCAAGRQFDGHPDRRAHFIDVVSRKRGGIERIGKFDIGEGTQNRMERCVFRHQARSEQTFGVGFFERIDCFGAPDGADALP